MQTITPKYLDKNVDIKGMRLRDIAPPTIHDQGEQKAAHSMTVKKVCVIYCKHKLLQRKYTCDAACKTNGDQNRACTMQTIIYDYGLFAKGA